MPGDAATVAEALRGQARDRADHPLLVCDGRRLSYADADRRSGELARGLIAAGTGKGTRVGLLYPNGSEFVVGMLAAARIGAVVVPFSTYVTARELRDQLIDSDARILLSTKTFRGHDYQQRLIEIFGGSVVGGGPLMSAHVPQLRHIGFDSAPLDSGSGEAAGPELLRAMEDDVDGSDELAIVYTSGSTSEPKGAVHTHAALLGHQRNLNAIRGLGADDRLFCNSPFFWIGGFAFGLLATLVAGSTLVCSNATDPAAVLDLIEAEKPTITNGFAAGVAQLSAHPSFAGRDLSSLRRGNLYPIMAPECRPADPELRHNMLGMTEAGSVLLISGDESDQPEARRGSYGKPAPGFGTKVVDGELCIRGPHLMQRYHRRSREECFDADGWFHTDDLVRVDAEGFIYFLGRRSGMIKTAGANVSAAEVQQAMAKRGIEAHVVGIPDAERGQVVAALVILPDGADALDEKELRDRLKTDLSAYKIPKRVRTLSRGDIPLLSSGKVDIRRLKSLFDD